MQNNIYCILMVLSTQGDANLELELDGLKATIEAVEIIDSVPTAGHGKEYDRFQDHSRAVTE